MRYGAWGRDEGGKGYRGKRRKEGGSIRGREEAMEGVMCPRSEVKSESRMGGRGERGEGREKGRRVKLFACKKKKKKVLVICCCCCL